MMRTVRAARNSTKTATTMSTMRPACMASSLGSCHERGGAPDLHDVDAATRLEGLVLVVGPGRPDLALQPHGPHVVVVRDALEDDGGLSHQRRGAGPQLRRHAHVTPGDGPHDAEQEQRAGEERGELPDGPDAG